MYVVQAIIQVRFVAKMFCVEGKEKYQKSKSKCMFYIALQSAKENLMPTNYVLRRIIARWLRVIHSNVQQEREWGNE